MKEITTSPKALLTNKDLRRDYGLGRDICSQLLKVLPHVCLGYAGAGQRRMVRREDVEELLKRAAKEGADLWQLVRQHTPESLIAWLNSEMPTSKREEENDLS